MLVDKGDEVVDIPITEVRGSKPHKDGSVLFNMFGGPYHGMTVRVFQPFMRVVFKRGNELDVYALHPPIRKAGLWVYAYDENDKRDYEPSEQGDLEWKNTVDARWATYRRWKRADDERRLVELERKEHHVN